MVSRNVPVTERQVRHTKSHSAHVQHRSAHAKNLYAVNLLHFFVRDDAEGTSGEE
jgi:hypothetical protein